MDKGESVMARPSLAEVEASLAAAVQGYLLAEPNERISEDENLGSVCGWLARWLRDMLGNADGWGPYRSVDDIFPCTVDRDSRTDLVLKGLLIWMDGGTQEWKEPLSAEIHLSASASMPFSYRVKVGDADRGLGKCPYRTQHDYPYVPVHRWLFCFVGPAAGG
jgi:hypothetical protein